MKIVRTKDVEWATVMDHGKFGGRRKELGGGKMSCGLWELPPGKKSFPMHLHHVTEEAMFVVSGRAKVRTPEGIRAKVRTPEGMTEIGPGDYVFFPTGGPAHQLVNDGTEPMIYLAIGAGIGVDIVEYPDSGKVACSIGPRPTGKRLVFRAKDQADYFEGEE